MFLGVWRWKIHHRCYKSWPLELVLSKICSFGASYSRQILILSSHLCAVVPETKRIRRKVGLCASFTRTEQKGERSVTVLNYCVFNVLPVFSKWKYRICNTASDLMSTKFWCFISIKHVLTYCLLYEPRVNNSPRADLFCAFGIACSFFYNCLPLYLPLWATFQLVHRRIKKQSTSNWLTPGGSEISYNRN